MLYNISKIIQTRQWPFKKIAPLLPSWGSRIYILPTRRHTITMGSFHSIWLAADRPNIWWVFYVHTGVRQDGMLMISSSHLKVSATTGYCHLPSQCSWIPEAQWDYFTQRDEASQGEASSEGKAEVPTVHVKLLNSACLCQIGVPQWRCL